MTNTYKFISPSGFLHGFVLVLTAFIYSPASTQQFTYRHYDEKDGLPSAVVYSITQDRDGFIWFGTENGLSRFDGKNFKTYTTRDGLPDNEILRVFAAKSGKLYFTAFTHKVAYMLNDTVHSLKIYPGEESNASTPGNFFANDDRVILNINGQFSYIIFPNDSVIPLSKLYTGLPKISGVYAANDTMFTCGHNENIYFVHNKRGPFGHIKNYHYAAFMGATKYNLPILEDYVSLPANSAGKNKFIFTVGKRSAYIFDCNNGCELFRRIPVIKATTVFIDSENNTWICTSGSGVYRFPSFNFRQVKFPVPVNEVFSMVRHKGKLLIGNNYSTVHEIVFKDTAKTIKSNDYSSYIRNSLNLTTSNTATNRVLRLFPRGDTLYLVSDAFLLKIEPHNKIKFNRAFPGKDIDADGGRLLVTTGNNAVLMDAKTFSVTDTILSQRTTTGVIHHDSYYIGTIGGLLKIDARTRQQTFLGNIYPELKKRIVSIRKGQNDDLWVATNGAGLINLKNDKIIRTLNTGSGLASDICTSLYIDSTIVWVGTNSGLSRIGFAHDSIKLMHFSTANGLSSNFINSLYVDGNTVYVGSSDGLNYFNKHLNDNESICALKITGVSAGNQALPVDSAYTFPHHALNIKIDFTAISFKSAGNNTYFYTLQGLDDDWNTTTNTFVNYATLPSGDYTFLIKAVNQFGVESETKSIRIIITPPWWQTGWFITLAGLAFASLVFFIYRRNINVIKRRERVKRHNEARFAALEQQALQAQMNPHFIFNCLNSIQSFILDFDAEGANQYLSAFASMIRQTLDISSHPLITVAEEIRYLDTYLQLEKLRFREKFNYRIEIDEEIDTFGTWIPGMFLQPYIENSLRHGIQHRADNEGLIVLSIRPWDKNGIVCRIIDNGVGRKKAAEVKSRQHIEYQSKGTFINSKRINAINNQFETNISVETGDVLDDNGEIAGTQVSIIIPQLRKP